MGKGLGLIDLDDCVINAIRMLELKGIPQFQDVGFKRPIVIASGNALPTAKILFKDKDALFADESNYLEEIRFREGIDGAIIVSSSGAKHAPLIAKTLSEKGFKVCLFTNNKHAPASVFSSKVFVFPRNTEPYTYNTSTYLGMIISKTRENPQEIMGYIKEMNKKIPKDLRKYDSYYFIVPNEFEIVKEMFATKFDELFGSRITARVFTPEQTKHARTIVESDKELFVSFAYKNSIFGKKRINFEMKNANFGKLIAAGYYFIGKIQKQNKPYFKENIKRYAKKASKIFNFKIEPIVQGDF